MGGACEAGTSVCFSPAELPATAGGCAGPAWDGAAAPPGEFFEAAGGCAAGGVAALVAAGEPAGTDLSSWRRVTNGFSVGRAATGGVAGAAGADLGGAVGAGNGAVAGDAADSLAGDGSCGVNAERRSSSEPPPAVCHWLFKSRATSASCWPVCCPAAFHSCLAVCADC